MGAQRERVIVVRRKGAPRDGGGKATILGAGHIREGVGQIRPHYPAGDDDLARLGHEFDDVDGPAPPEQPSLHRQCPANLTHGVQRAALHARLRCRPTCPRRRANPARIASALARSPASIRSAMAAMATSKACSVRVHGFGVVRVGGKEVAIREHALAQALAQEDRLDLGGRRHSVALEEEAQAGRRAAQRPKHAVLGAGPVERRAHLGADLGQVAGHGLVPERPQDRDRRRERERLPSKVMPNAIWGRRSMYSRFPATTESGMPFESALPKQARSGTTP